MKILKLKPELEKEIVDEIVNSPNFLKELLEQKKELLKKNKKLNLKPLVIPDDNSGYGC